ncbi:EXS family-domain-containing protein [Jimgerdemannia flammicorona]|uniref:EXS family-domain-containing protein n=1 Tax=Jimgerdemannia flammicorona TaxID=994334 RepID=A0A433D1U7_9FUNG|nr:EXS family-domain-containing protein [Jimgerdemannia flammicorona]
MALKKSCTKIITKFDECAGTRAREIYLREFENYRFLQSNILDNIIEEVETHHLTSWRVGIYMGLSIPLLINAIMIDPNNRLPTFDMNIQIYACFALPIIFCLGFGANIVIWNRAQINYRYIFELDLDDTVDFQQFLEHSFILQLPALFLFLLIQIIYLDFSGMIPNLSQWFPAIYFCIVSTILLCPFPILYRSSRWWLIRTMVRILLSGFLQVEFCDFFMADGLASISYSFWTFGYFICTYYNHTYDIVNVCNIPHMWMAPFVAALPAWWRLMQCLRRYCDSRQYFHLVNAGKYFVSILTSIMVGPKRIIDIPATKFAWIAISVSSSIYSLIWDLVMDWNLFTQNRRLRNNLVFQRWVYYFAIISNTFLRFIWIITLGSSTTLAFVAALLEMCRRIQWNIFRLENEHLHNNTDLFGVNSECAPKIS